MYFTVFGFNGVQKGQWVARGLKIAQLVHLSPKATFTVQMLGEVIDAIFNYIITKTIVPNRFDIFTSIERSNIWSGQNVQQYNTLVLAWSIAGDMVPLGLAPNGDALDGGTQVMVFILSFAVFGRSGRARDFPLWGENHGRFASKNL
ncbi:putative opt oligopeptide transporter protein [Botrytis fragariae]|uniref:Putative opt oligopeptide transporter protein n=1 Tax=Botrytis fragariae TaxID=1964551 RepID=A0A8H6AIB8_9HELO|nr:putative opt oligopeptide transporter protein [Botrytis fragariae]KAF5868313.1 putative opt oligopeptide transporter protein [Botrytis fragariae]